ncbi:hypothetical protein EJB05_44320, partial [Eragrostis curvula]
LCAEPSQSRLLFVHTAKGGARHSREKAAASITTLSVSFLTRIVLRACRAPLLKSLILVSCCEVSHRGLLEAIERFPLLRELEVTACPKVCKVKLVEVVAMACPRLQHLRICHPVYLFYYCSNDREATAISRMREIRSLQLVYSELSNQGLSAILDNCPHLESLDVRRCRHIIVDEALRAKCARINSVKLLLHERDDDDYCEESELPSPISWEDLSRLLPRNPWWSLRYANYARGSSTTMTSLPMD